MSDSPIRCGDHVYHAGCDEFWVVRSVDYEAGKLFWMGWPPGCADLAACTRVYACSDQEHAYYLDTVGRIGGPREESPREMMG